MSHSISELLENLKDGESEAENLLWRRFIDRLMAVSRRKLRGFRKRAVDEEDVAIEAFDAFFRGTRDGRFLDLNDRHDLWTVLLMLTERKALQAIRKELAEKRGGGLLRGESVFENLLQDCSGGQGIAGVESRGDIASDLFTSEVRDRLTELEDETMKKIALMKLEGYENLDIGSSLNISLRTVERKLNLIRKQWEFSG